MTRCLILFFLISYLNANTVFSIFGNIEKVTQDSIYYRNCPDYVDSCIYVCNDGITNPCHPDNLYSISIDSSSSDTSTEGLRYRIYFPWEFEGMTADKFTVTASWPCLSPTAVYASGDYAYWDLYGNANCPGTVQGSVWYGDDCEDDYGNIGNEDCKELVGRFCFVVGDTLEWAESSDQSISTDICDDCWMSSPAWIYYDTWNYSDSLLYPTYCEFYDHCHHSTPDSIMCGIGYLDGSNLSAFDEVDMSVSQLIRNYPNPFNASTKIEYSLKNNTNLSIAIYDIKGSLIKVLYRGYNLIGNHKIKWDGKNNMGIPVSGSMYFVIFNIDNNYHSKKIILLK